MLLLLPSIIGRFLMPLALLALPLAGCGGGVYVGIGDGIGGDDPEVELAVTPDPVASGGRLTLVAAASDDSGEVDEVEFFRLVDGRRESLGRLDRPPFRLDDVPAPVVSASTRVDYVAWAWDHAGHRGESAVVGVTVTP